MKVAYTQGNESGFGELVFSEELFPDGPWQIAIERGSDRQFLSRSQNHPWTGEINFQQLDCTGKENGSLAFAVGPEIVDELDPQEAYRVKLKGASGEPLSAVLRIGTINHSPAGTLKNTARPELKAKPAQKTAQKPAPERAQPDPEPERAKQPEAPELLDLAAKRPEPKRGRKYLQIAMLLVLIAACAAWYWLDPRKNAQEAEPSVVAAAPVASAEEQVRQFFRGGTATPGHALALAERLPKTTAADQDAVYRLYYYAAENNEPGAALLYGACLDPAQPAWGSIEKNAPAAWRAYKKAHDQDKAAATMTAMRGWLEDQSRAGNAQAAKWLREIEK